MLYTVETDVPTVSGITKPIVCGYVGGVVVTAPVVADKNNRAPGVALVIPAIIPSVTISTVLRAAPPFEIMPIAGRLAESLAAAL
jgi:hypothetical protein